MIFLIAFASVRSRYVDGSTPIIFVKPMPAQVFPPRTSVFAGATNLFSLSVCGGSGGVVAALSACSVVLSPRNLYLAMVVDTVRGKRVCVLREPSIYLEAPTTARSGSASLDLSLEREALLLVPTLPGSPLARVVAVACDSAHLAELQRAVGRWIFTAAAADVPVL